MECLFVKRRTIMAKMTVGPGGIETISGALKKPVKKEGHRHGNYVIAVHRQAETTNPDCQRLYVKNPDAYKRTTPVTRDELAKRERFAAVSRAVANRAQNLSTLTQDQEAYIAQKNLPGGKKSFKSYLWSLELAAYDAQHQG